MSEMEIQSAEMAQAGRASPGAMLKVARQSQNMHIEALAVALKVPVGKLEALEADNYAALPDAVFVRALASSVCRSLKIDPAPVLALMPQSGVPSLSADSAGINAAFKDGSEKARTGAIVSRALHPVFLAVLALLLGAVAILTLFPHATLEQAQTGTEPVAGPAAGQPVTESVVASSEPAPVSTPSQPANPVAAAAAPIPAPVPGPAQDVPAAVPAAALVTPVPAAGTMAEAAPDLLMFHARSESWIQVRDASGATTLQRVVAAGERVVAPGKPPFAVVVGNANATEVFVRGKVMDLVSVSRDNVARFEVKP